MAMVLAVGSAVVFALLLAVEVGRSRRSRRNLAAARGRARDARRDAAGARAALTHVARDRDQLAADLDVLVQASVARHPSSAAAPVTQRFALIQGGAA